MEQQLWIEEVVNRLPVDIRAEVIIADLVELGLELDDVVVSPKGLGKRSFSFDILSAKWIENKSDRELLHIYVSRESLYDALPEGLFHQPSTKKHFRSTQEMIDEVKRAKEEEESARRFFAPLEQEFYRQRINTESGERKTLSQLKENSKSDLFVDFWQLEDIFSNRQLSVMLNLLPLAYKIAGDLEFAAQCFENVLQTSIRIRPIEPLIRHMPEEQMIRLGNGTLGADTVLGHSFHDGSPAIEIRIGPVKSNAVLEYVPGGRGLKVIDRLIAFFIPVDTEVKTLVTMDEKTFGFSLDQQKESCRLGFNTAFTKSKISTNIA